MNWTITARKFLEGVAEGATAATVAITLLPGDPGYWTAIGGALVIGAIRGGLNAWKHL